MRRYLTRCHTVIYNVDGFNVTLKCAGGVFLSLLYQACDNMIILRRVTQQRCLSHPNTFTGV